MRSGKAEGVFRYAAVLDNRNVFARYGQISEMNVQVSITEAKVLLHCNFDIEKTVNCTEGMLSFMVHALSE